MSYASTRARMAKPGPLAANITRLTYTVSNAAISIDTLKPSQPLNNPPKDRLTSPLPQST